MIKIESTYALSKNIKNYFKPNEDYLINDNHNNIYIVLDGVSRDRVEGNYPIPSPSADVSMLFGHEVHIKLLEKYPHNDYLKILEESIKYANTQVEKYNLQKKDWDFLPGTVGLISMIKNNTFYFAYNGDCTGRLIRKSKTKLFTYSQTEKIHRHIKEFSADTVRNIIVNNIRHPYGYGVFNGQPKAMDFVKYGKIELKLLDTIILASDGLTRYFEENDLNLELNSNEIIDLVILEESQNMNLSSDDKSLIIIRIG